ncbi:hypothetical protein VKT23_017460 [Stygiomarasmius scandens]|uniref:F-box domain-containing protein n=1 Tax=Marasmiellus scandens TaxID=2682957 RepID=A0ABR1IRX2_9AGAR
MEPDKLEQALSDPFPIHDLREILHEEEEQLKSLKSRGSIMLKKQRIALLQSALAPIRHLPIEILTSIFEAYLDMRLGENTITDKDYDQVHLYCLPPVLFLSQVCSQWRQVVDNCPTLWKRLRLFLGKRGGLPPVELVRTWLNRSGSLALEIDISKDLFSQGKASIWDPHFLDCLVPFCERWRELKLELDFCMLKSFIERDALNLPLLEVLRIGAGCIKRFRYIRAFQNAPRLRELDISSWGRKQSQWHQRFISSFGHNISFHNLTSLQIHMGRNGASGSPSGYLRILSRCTKLEKCSLGIDDFDEHPLSLFHFTDVEPVTLASLKELDISFCGDHGSPQLLNAFTFPSLRSLSLYVEDPCSPSLAAQRVPILDILLRLQARSRFPLERLEFLDMSDSIDTDGMLEFFKVVPSLERVELHNCVVDAHQLTKALVVGKDLKKSLLPKLSYINVSEYGEDNIIDHGPRDDDHIADMVESRCVALSAKKAFHMKLPVFEVEFEIFRRHLREDVLDRLEDLEEEWDAVKLRIATSDGDDDE